MFLVLFLSFSHIFVFKYLILSFFPLPFFLSQIILSQCPLMSFVGLYQGKEFAQMRFRAFAVSVLLSLIFVSPHGAVVTEFWSSSNFLSS